MNSGININVLKSDIISFKDVQSHSISVPFLDYNTNYPSMGGTATISSQLYNKHITLGYVDIIDNFSLDVLIEHIENEFFIQAQTLGYKNRKNLLNESQFDILLKNKKNSKDLIISKLNMIQFEFSKNTRLGGYSFLASNFSTFMNIREYMNMPFEVITINDKHTLNGIPYIINNNLDEDVLLIGRKNNINQQGIHCFILTDNNKNLDIQVNERFFNNTTTFYRNPYNTPSKNYRISYKIDDIGLNPEYQYLIIKTSDIQTTRCNKLKKIKELYE